MNDVETVRDATRASFEPALLSVEGVTLQYKTPDHLVTATTA
jgi:hypothetical protein